MKFKTKLIIILIIVILLCVIGYFARKVIIFNNYRLAQEKFSKIDNRLSFDAWMFKSS